MFHYYSFFFSSCSDDNDIINEAPKTIKNKLFTNSENLLLIKNLSNEYNKIQSRELKNNIPLIDENYIKLYNNSINYLIEEGDLTRIEILSLFPDTYDQRVIITAIGLSENISYNNSNNIENSSISYRSGVGNCVLEAVGINALVKGAGKKVAAKVLSRFVPYAGWGLAAVDFADCMDWF